MLESPHFDPPPPAKGQRGEPQPPKVTVSISTASCCPDHTVDASKLLIAGKNAVLVLIQSRLGGDVPASSA